MNLTLTPALFIGLVCLATFAGVYGALTLHDWVRARRSRSPVGRMLAARRARK